MTAIKIRGADDHSFDQVLSLLTRNGLPQQGLSDHVSTTLVAEEAGQIVGSAALELYGEVALLRSVAVDPCRRNQGIGRRLVEDALVLADQHRIREVYLLTESAAPYFARHGFRNVERVDVAPAVKSSVEFQSACPQSAQVMVKVFE